MEKLNVAYVDMKVQAIIMAHIHAKLVNCSSGKLLTKKVVFNKKKFTNNLFWF